jgi:hypothetical protein
LVPVLQVGGLTAAAFLPGAGASPTPREAGAPVPVAVSGLQQLGSKPSAAANPIRVTVAENSPDTVVDLGAVFRAVSGIQQKDGLQLALLGNTNSGLVKTDLSATVLTLTYARGKSGQATVTVSATDADGVSVQQTLLVTVRPL